jgi:preprotein translocase subunit Sec61beta
VTGRDDTNSRDRDENFVQNVLGQTSGSACGRCGDLLPDLVEGRLEDLDRQLTQAHLEHCTACRAVAVTLGWLTPLLPAMVELDPGEAFTSRVLDATSRRRRVIEAGPTGAAGLMDRLGRWWEEQVLKPDFAVQAAYAATIILVLLATVPGSPLKGAPGKALEAVQAGPEGLPIMGPALLETSTWVDNRADGAVTTLRAGLVSRWDRAESGLTERAERTQKSRTAIRTHLAGMFDHLGNRDIGEAGTEFYAALKAGNTAWTIWWDEDEDGNGP